MTPKLVILLSTLTGIATAAPFDPEIFKREYSGEIKADGSSSVYLISKGLAREFQKQQPKVTIAVGISGTGGGFKKFAARQADIANASRPMKTAELEACQKNKVEPVELQVAWDAIAVIVNQENTWAEKLTAEQLKKIWHPDTQDFKNAKQWSDIDPKWPKERLFLYGPGSDSGTFDFFTEKINGKEKTSRPDFIASEDDQVIMKGVIENKHALAYVNWPYALGFKDKVKIVAIAPKAGEKFVMPTKETISDGSYQPLSRPLYIYVSKASLQKPQVLAFTAFHLAQGDFVEKLGYLPMTKDQQKARQESFGKVLDELKK